MSTFNSIADDVKLGENVRLSKFINLYGCEVGDDTKIGAFVARCAKKSRIGKRCKISSHTFICEGVEIEDNVFVGHSVTFINDKFPRATNLDGSLQDRSKFWTGRAHSRKERGIDRLRRDDSRKYDNPARMPLWEAGQRRNEKILPANAIVAGNPARFIRMIPTPNNEKSNAPVPFLDLITPHLELEDELVKVFRESLRTAGFVGGPIVENFEKAFADYCAAKHSIAVNSGTDALRFALIAAGVKTGDVVVTVPNTFIATCEAISQANATPEFVDIDEQTYNLSVPMLRKFIEEQCTLDSSGQLQSLREISARSPRLYRFVCTDRWPTWMESRNWQTATGS